MTLIAYSYIHYTYNAIDKAISTLAVCWCHVDAASSNYIYIYIL